MYDACIYLKTYYRIGVVFIYIYYILYKVNFRRLHNVIFIFFFCRSLHTVIIMLYEKKAQGFLIKKIPNTIIVLKGQNGRKK
jgi:hypothetical protein